tara:strand:+ start:377 stop:754 length:378 start_codon:yes stop_codon:yes gene_type:complete
MRITEKKLRKLIRETIESTMRESDDDYRSNPIFGDFGDTEIVGSEDDELDGDDMYSDVHYMSDMESSDLDSSGSSGIVPDDLDDWRNTDSYRGLDDEELQPDDYSLDLIEDPMYMDTEDTDYFEN